MKYKPEKGLQSKLTRLHKVNKSVISKIKYNKTWQHVEV